MSAVLVLRHPHNDLSRAYLDAITIFLLVLSVGAWLLLAALRGKVGQPTAEDDWKRVP
ncbi:MAG: hypothetical protein M3290_09850 [Actinomycetota bacterium]|nr:hypothetical protein [Actinomycetota bacterium]